MAKGAIYKLPQIAATNFGAFYAPNVPYLFARSPSAPKYFQTDESREAYNERVSLFFLPQRSFLLFSFFSLPWEIPLKLKDKLRRKLKLGPQLNNELIRLFPQLHPQLHLATDLENSARNENIVGAATARLARLAPVPAAATAVGAAGT